MGLIGSFGDVIFEVSSERMRTFHDFSRSASARWATHEIMRYKPALEFLGPDLDTISFQMRFETAFGVDPKLEMDKLLRMCRSGQAEQLIIGGSVMGYHQWVCDSIRQNWQKVDGRGRIIVGVVEVTLIEYDIQEVRW